MRIKYLKVFAAVMFLLFTSAAVYSQQDGGSDTVETSDSDWYYGKHIKSVSFKGLKSVQSKEVDGVTGSFLGKQFSDELFADLLDRIYALDLFDDITPEAVPGDSKRNTVAIVFTVKERPVISRILVSGNKQVRTADIKDTVSIKEKDIFIAGKVLIDERAVRDLYLGKGFTNVKVTSSTKQTEKGVEVSFIIDEGRSTVISNLAFRGNKIVSDKTLRGKLKLKEVGLFNKGAFQESMLEADKQAILSYYQNLGYIDAVIVDVTQETSINKKKNRDELTITFVIQEYSQYTFGGITFNGNRIFDDNKLAGLIKLKNGAVFNQSKFQESVMAVADLYYENGYTSNRFQPIPSKDTENKVITYVFNITENVRSHVESVTVKGNTKTKEHVILREIPIESGDIFSKEKVTTGLRNLYNLQYFSAVVPDIISGSEENLVDLVISVEEQSTTSIEFGVTFSGVSDPDDLPFALFVKWQDSNIAGLGKSVSVGTTVATDEQSLSLSYGENWFMGLPLSSSITTEISHANLSALRLKYLPDGSVDSDSYYMDYEQWKWSLGLSLGHRWTPDWAILSLSGGITGSLKSNIYNDDLWIPVDTSVSDYANKWGWQNSVYIAGSIDDRDINYDPSKGWFTSQRFTWYGITPLEDEYFLRTDTKLEKYFTLLNLPVSDKWNLKMVLAGYTGLSMLFPYSGTSIGDTSRLYVDGMFNGRGWTSIYNTVRGRAMWSSNIELRMPLVPGVIALDWFGDAAAIKKQPTAMFTNLCVEDFYFSTGPGIRFSIPQFPLRLLFANTFKVEDSNIKWDKKWKFVLSFNLTNK